MMERRLSFSTTSELLQVPAGAVVYVKADGNEHVLTLQVGQIEQHIADTAEAGDRRFIRIGKSLIVNSDFISFINVPRRKLVLSDCRTFSHELSASREALRSLKDVLDGLSVDS